MHGKDIVFSVPQKKIIPWIIGHERCNVFAGMGLGKTVSALTSIKALKSLGLVKKTLVISTKRVSSKVWSDEIKEWSHLYDLRVNVLAGHTATKRVSLLLSPADIYTINYENLVWLYNTLNKIKNSNSFFDMIVADESSRLKGFRLRGGRRNALALARIAFNAPRYVNMTGTPRTNHITDLWAQMYYIDRGLRLGATIGAFKNRYYIRGDLQAKITSKSGKKIEIHKEIQKAQAEKEISELIKDVTLTLRTEDYFDVLDIIKNNVYGYMDEKTYKLYRSMEKKLYVEINDKTITAVNAAVKSSKCLQMASGFIYNEGIEERIHDGKIQALESIVEELQNENILVVYHWNPDIKYIKEAFPECKALKTKAALKYFKKNELESDEKTINDWNAGKIKMLLVHSQSAGHGLNLQHGGRTIVIYSHYWSAECYAQVIERIGPMRQLQAGYNRNVLQYNIIMKDTIDELAVASKESNINLQSLLLKHLSEKYER